MDDAATRMQRRILLAALLALAVAPGAPHAAAPPVRALIVALSPQAAAAAGPARLAERAAALAQARTGLGLRALRRIDARTAVLALPRPLAGADLASALAALRADPAVAWAEPDWRVQRLALPSDPRFTDQWPLMAPSTWPGGADLPDAWDVTTGDAGVVVAVIDTGAVPHQDLDANVTDGSGRLLPGYDFVSLDTDPGGACDNQPCVANDGDGWDADPSDPGDWITAAEADSDPANDPYGGFFAGCPIGDSSWHGLGVAGIAGALTDNARDVAGVAWEVRILPVRVLGKCGGRLSDAAAAIRWAAGLSVPGAPANPNPARVINLSLGLAIPCPATLQAAIDAARAAGATVVAAAGNDAADTSGWSPASCAGVVVAAAHDRDGTAASYTNHGAEVDVSAPGGDAQAVPVLSNSGATGPDPSPGGDRVAGMVGTSAAAPHVSGVAALMQAAFRAAGGAWLAPDTLEQKLEATARAFAPGAFATGGCGAGLLDAADAVRAAGTAPTADAGSDRLADPGEAVTLDGRASADDAWGQVAAYAWRQTAGPAVALAGADTATPSFTVPQPAAAGAQLVFALEVTDDLGLRSAPDTVTVTVRNVAPVLDAGPDRTVGEGQSLSFTVTASDANGDVPVLAASGLPPGASFDAATGRFDWPAAGPAGSYTVAFVARDALDPGLSDSDSVTITVTAAGAGQGAGGGTASNLAASGGGGGGSAPWLAAAALAALARRLRARRRANRGPSSIRQRTRR